MKKQFTRNTAIGAACALGLGLIVAPQAAVAADEVPAADPGTAAATQTVNLLHFNDFHGRITGAETDDGEYTPSSTVMFAATIEQLRAAAPADSTLLLSGGDNIGASNFTSASQQDEPTLDVLNALDLSASAVGNHEFDQGVADLTGRVADSADFPYLSANVTLNGAPIGPGYATFEIGDVTVAVVGAVTEQTPSLVDGSGIVGVEFSDPVTAINAIAADLTDGDAANDEADVIVAEIHEGSQVLVPLNAPQEEQQALLGPDAAAGGVFGNIVNNLSADVDVIFNGHTHRTYTWMAPVPGVEGATRPVVQSNEYSNLVGQVTLTVDTATGDVVSVDELTNHERLTASSQAEVDALIAQYPRVGEVSGIAEAAVTQAEIVGNQPVGTISGPITVPLESNSNRGEESTAAQMVANMYRDQLASDTRGGAEIGIVNPGGVRDSFLYEASGEETEDGVVTLAEANTMLPFINNLWTITMTGAQLDTLLEQQWQRSADGVPFTSGRTYLQLGLSDNVTYVSDPSRPMDDRVSDIQIDGAFITDDQEIRIASASFLIGVGGSQPGDNFWAFAEGTDARDSGLVDQDALLAYLGDNPGLAPDYTVRHVDVTPLPAEPVVAGTEVAIEIGQLDRIRSTGATASEWVEVRDAAGAVVGTGTVVVNVDEAGAPLTTSASLVFTATTDRTDGSTGVEEYRIVTSNGSEIPLQLEVTAEAESEGPGNGNGHAYGHSIGQGHSSHGNGHGYGHDKGHHRHGVIAFY